LIQRRSTISTKATIIENKNDNRREVFVPVAFAMVVKSLQKLNLAESSITVSFTLVMRLLFDGVPDEVRDFLLKEGNIALRINEEPFSLDEKQEIQKTLEKKSNIYRMTWRKTAEILFDSKFDEFPFDDHKVRIKVELTSPFFEEQRTNIRWNVLNNEDRDTLLSFKNEADLLPEFNIATNASYVVFPEPERKDYPEGAIYYKPVVEYYIYLFRQPGYVVLSTAAPLFMINLATLACLAFPPDAFSDKMSIIVTLMLALFAFMPSLRSFIPKVPYLTILEYQLYFVLGIMFLVLIESITNFLLSGNTSLSSADTDVPSSPVGNVTDNSTSSGSSNEFANSVISYAVFGISISVTIFQTIYFVIRLVYTTYVKHESFITPEDYTPKKISGSAGGFNLAMWGASPTRLVVEYHPESKSGGYTKIEVK